MANSTNSATNTAKYDWQAHAVIRRVREADIDRVLEIFEGCRSFMRDSGNPTQWAGTYPGEAEVRRDISSGEGYTVVVEDAVEGYFTLMNGPDPHYARIINGAWPDDEPYAAVHRIASSGKYAGFTDFIMDFCKNRYKNLRIDTHSDNTPMQNGILRNGFTYCGIVYMDDGTPRNAYWYRG